MLKIGQRVRVYLPQGEQTISQAVRKFNGKVAKVTANNRHIPARQGAFFTYQLEGCKSRYGFPYEFLEEWLIPYDVEEEQL